MSPARPTRFRFSLRWGALVSLLGFIGAYLLGATRLRWLFGLLALILLLVLGWRALARWRGRLLWRLRNRLIVAYVFIGLIPLVLLVLVGLIGFWTIYGKVAVYLVTDNLASIHAELRDLASDFAASLELASALDNRLPPDRLDRLLELHRRTARQRFPSADVRLLGGPGPNAPALPDWLRNQQFSGVVLGEEGEAELLSARPVQLSDQVLTVVYTVPLDTELMPQLGRDVGLVSVTVLGDPAGSSTSRRPRRIPVRDTSYPVLKEISDPRPLPAPFAWWDTTLTLAASHPTYHKQTGREGPPLVLFVQSRVAAVHRQLAYRLGEFSGLPFTVLTAFGILFLVLELVAFRIGVKLTRTITIAVNDLQAATERIQRGDFSYRIQLRDHDQLGGLAQAFNTMTASIERLIEESKEKQRLQNELEIARQVQEQLFPRDVPPLQTLELVGRCRPARTVSGDYYDYGLAEPGRLLFTIGDISGKGISAALLMATIQSALRTQVYASRLEGGVPRLGVAALVSRVNRQLCATTSAEKFSSLFVGLYDDSTRRLTYTNAGHLAPVVLGSGRRLELSTGGSVVGLFPDNRYEEDTIELRSGEWLVAFTDGVTEVENSYEEEYGQHRLVTFLERAADSLTPDRLIEAVLNELEQWSPGREPNDDCTLLVARVR